MNNFQRNIYRTVNTELPLTEYCYRGYWHADDTIHVPPGGNIVYEDEFGVEQTIQGIVSEDGVISVMSSIIPTTFGVSNQLVCNKI